MSRRASILLVATAAATLALLPSPDHAGASNAAACARSSIPRPATEARPFNVGNAQLGVALPVSARFVAVPDGRPGAAWVQEDGWIRTKLGWSAPSRPAVTGRRLDRPAAALRARVGVRSVAEQGAFYPSHLLFPTTGCWKVMAKAGTARLSFVVEVVRR